MTRPKRGLPLFLLFMLPWIPASLSGCRVKEAPDFVFRRPEGGPDIYALSRRAVKGVLPLGGGEGRGGDRKIEYVLELPVTMPENSALELHYSLKGAGDRETSGSQAPVRTRVILRAGGSAWELPLDLSFLGISGADEIVYTVPLSSVPVDRVTITAEGGGGPGGKASPGEFEIRSMGFTPLWFGFEAAEGEGRALSPFVYTAGGSGGEPVLVIDPPESFMIKGGVELLAESRGGGVTVKGGGRSLRASGFLRLPPGFLGEASFPLSVSSAGGTLPSASLRPVPVPPFPAAIPADPGIILAYPRDAWRERGFEVFSWENFPSILILDTADYAVQDRILKRLAFFVEKAGFRGRLARDNEIRGLHGWNAHDYRAEDLAAFFDAAERSRFPLLDEERELERILLSAGIILRTGGGIAAGRGALLSISRESSPVLRSLFMAHEGFHGLFFIDEAFRNFSRRRWEALGPLGKTFLINYFDYQGYDVTDPFLVVNEFMAHVLQQGTAQAHRYFGETVARRLESSPRRRGILPPGDERGTWPELGRIFREEAEAFSAYVADRYGLAAGRVHRVEAGE